jgi:hypothetical protein
LHYQQVVKNPRYEDFEISYFEKNIWAHLGMGWTVQDRRGPKEADVSPHFCLDNIDPKWYASSEGFSLRLLLISLAGMKQMVVTRKCLESS